MTDQEKQKKTIRGLKCIAGMNEMKVNPCIGCGYDDCETYAICVSYVANDALALLKEQEPQKAKHIISTAVSAMGDCPSCGARLSTGFLHYQAHTKFCYNCGQAVKWND